MTQLDHTTQGSPSSSAQTIDHFPFWREKEWKVFVLCSSLPSPFLDNSSLLNSFRLDLRRSIGSGLRSSPDRSQEGAQAHFPESAAENRAYNPFHPLKNAQLTVAQPGLSTAAWLNDICRSVWISQPRPYPKPNPCILRHLKEKFILVQYSSNIGTN